MQVQVLLFAGARMLAGSPSVAIDVEPPVTVADLLHGLAVQHPQLKGLVSAGRLAVDGRYASDEETIPAGKEVAFIPPVSGG